MQIFILHFQRFGCSLQSSIGVHTTKTQNNVNLLQLFCVPIVYRSKGQPQFYFILSTFRLPFATAFRATYYEIEILF